MHIAPCTLHTEHCTLNTAHSTLHTPHCTLHTANCTVYTAHCIVHTAHRRHGHCILHTANCMLHNKYCTLYISHCTLHTTNRRGTSGDVATDRNRIRETSTRLSDCPYCCIYESMLYIVMSWRNLYCTITQIKVCCLVYWLREFDCYSWMNRMIRSDYRSERRINTTG